MGDMEETKNRHIKREIRAIQDLDHEDMITEKVENHEQYDAVSARIKRASESLKANGIPDVVDVEDDLEFAESLRGHARELFVRKKIAADIVSLREGRGFDDVVFRLERQKNELLHDLHDNDGNE